MFSKMAYQERYQFHNLILRSRFQGLNSPQNRLSFAQILDFAVLSRQQAAQSRSQHFATQISSVFKQTTGTQSYEKLHCRLAIALVVCRCLHYIGAVTSS